MWRWIDCNCSWIAWRISKPNSFLSNKTEVNPGIRGRRKPFCEWARCQKAIGKMYSTWNWRVEARELGLVPPDHLLLDRPPKIGPLISRWKLDEFKNCWKKSFRTSKILTLLYQQFSNLLIFQQDMSCPRLGALSNNRWSGRYLTISNPGLKAVSSNASPD
jgi:hypothetical protein